MGSLAISGSVSGGLQRTRHKGAGARVERKRGTAVQRSDSKSVRTGMAGVVSAIPPAGSTQSSGGCSLELDALSWLVAELLKVLQQAAWQEE